MKNVLPLFRCPYCPRTGVGIVAIDLVASAALVRTAQGTIDAILAGDSVASDGGKGEGIVLFNPDAYPNLPCPHVVAMLVEVDLREDAASDPKVTYAGTYDHPWFAANDMDQDISIYLWTEVLGGVDPAFHPTTPFIVRRKRLTKSVDGTQFEIFVAAQVILAMEPGLFFEQTRKGHESAQAFYERERGTD